jgi:pyruvate ferredoxin oxidoreductase gamma subunit
MSTTVEIKWFGQAGHGVLTAARTLARIFASEGRYVQSLFELSLQQRGVPVMAFNRVSDDPIRLHSWAEQVDVVAIIDSPQFFSPDFVNLRKESTAFVINSPANPDMIKKKFDLPGNSVYTLDANTISREEIGRVIPGISILSIVLIHLNMISLDDYKRRLQECLSLQFDKDIVEDNMRSFNRAVSEVNKR